MSTKLMPTYSRFDVEFTSGSGAWLFDKEGRKYLDLLSGIGVTVLGHSHPEIAETICSQVKTLLHTSNLFYTEKQQALANELSRLSLGGKVFFSNSGAEANECAFKLARKYGNEHLSGAYEIISAEKSFHGRTLATLAATGQPDKKEGFQPMPGGFTNVPFNDFEAAEEAVSSKTCAIILELIQGEGGVNVADKEYIMKIRELCGKKDILLIFDEVQTGMGRTGKFFAYQHYGVTPDIVTVAKGLANGLPIGATISCPQFSDVLSAGKHASTFGGGPVSCAAALKTIQVIVREGLIEKNRQTGDLLMEKLNNIGKETGTCKEVRGMGLMLGYHLNTSNAKEITQKCLDNGLIVGYINNDIVRFLPPFVIGDKEIDMAMDIFKKSLAEATKER